MKVYDVYKLMKVKYPKYVVLIKVGIFYEVYSEDAYIMANLFGYKVKEMGDCVRVGFPVSAFAKVTAKLNGFKINYVVIDKENVTKKKFNRNTYDVYVNEDMDIARRIENVHSRLNILKESPKIVSILDKIESFL